jgi:hypothetical protein
MQNINWHLEAFGAFYMPFWAAYGKNQPDQKACSMWAIPSPPQLFGHGFYRAAHTAFPMSQ